MKEKIRHLLLFIFYGTLFIWPGMFIGLILSAITCKIINNDNFCRIKQSGDRINDFEFVIGTIIIIWIIIGILVYKNYKKKPK